MESTVVRRAVLGDQEQLAKVHIQSWQEAYKGIVPKSFLDQLPNELEERTAMWNGILKSGKRWAWAAEVAGKIVGFILFGPPRDENREGYVELGAIYLLQAHKSKGIGLALLKTGFGSMKDMGFDKSYCWVLAGNPTIQFYEKSGAVFSGQKKQDEIGGEVFDELAYEWKSIEI